VLININSGVITVYAEIACPYATFALHRLRAARQRLGTRVVLDLRAYPLELVNKRPHSLAKFETEKPALVGQEAGLDWRSWRAERSTWPVTTLIALEAVQAAKRPEVGGFAASDELDAALRRALFLDSRCIAVLPVVLEVAEECPSIDRAALASALRAGGGRAEVFAQLEYAESGAVLGSPHVFLPNGRDWFNPGLELDHRGDYAAVKHYDPHIYEEILRDAGAA
jgi:predicted DsbA family dithiol-disulfide isomerase